MAHDYATDRAPASTTGPEPVAAAVEPTPAPTTFTSAGAIPAVDTATASPAPTASDRAFGPAPAAGPGVQALQALLAKGHPEAKQVVDLIDAHRDEHDAMFAVLSSTAGAAFTQQVKDQMGKLRASVGRREVVAGDPTDPSSGFFIGSQAEQGARWRTANGDFTGTANKTGLDTRYRLNAHDALHGHVGADKTGSLAWEHDGKTEGELYGNYKSSSSYEAGLRRTWDVGGGLTTGVRHQVDGNGATDGVYGNYKTADGKTTAEGAVGLRGGSLVESASVTTKPTAHDTLTGAISHDGKGTSLSASETHTFDGGSVAGTFAHDPSGTTLGASGTRTHDGTTLTGAARLHHGADGTTGSLSGTYAHGGTNLDGSITRAADRTSLHLGGSQQVNPELKVSGHLDHVAPDHGGSQTTLGLSERYRSGRVIHGLDLEAGKGERDYLKTTGSMDAQLGKNLYGGAWGSYAMESGHHDSAQIGASLTFTPSEKTALTLAGVLDQDGALEARLQLDVFKSKIASVSDLADHKKDALVSLFLSYTQGGNHHMLDDRFGAPQGSTPIGAGQVMAGIRIKF